MVKTLAVSANSGAWRSVVRSQLGMRPVCQSWQWMTSGRQSSTRAVSRAARAKKVKRWPSSG